MLNGVTTGAPKERTREFAYTRGDSTSCAS